MTEQARRCKYRHCQKRLRAPVRKGGRPLEYCDGTCRKGEFRSRLMDEEIRQAREAEQRREAMWAQLLPATRTWLRRIHSTYGADVSMQVTEAIIAEIQAHERSTHEAARSMVAAE